MGVFTFGPFQDGTIWKDMNLMPSMKGFKAWRALTANSGREQLFFVYL